MQAYLMTVVVGGVVSVALGQLAPPPAEPEDARQDVLVDSLKARQQGPGIAPNPDAEAQRVAEMEYESLVRYDEDGRIVPIEPPVELAALRANPVIGPDLWPSVDAAIAQWYRRVVRNVVDNVDLIRELDEGLIDRLEPHDAQQMGQLQLILQALNAPGALNDFLMAKGIIDGQQHAKTRQIYTEYLGALGKQWANDVPFDPAGTEARQLQQLMLTKKQWTFSIQDSMHAFEQVVLVASRRIDELIRQADLPPEKAKLFGPVRALPPDADDATRIQAFKQALWRLDPIEQRTLLTPVIDWVEPPHR